MPDRTLKPGTTSVRRANEEFLKSLRAAIRTDEETQEWIIDLVRGAVDADKGTRAEIRAMARDVIETMRALEKGDGRPEQMEKEYSPPLDMFQWAKTFNQGFEKGWDAALEAATDKVGTDLSHLKFGDGHGPKEGTAAKIIERDKPPLKRLAKEGE